jgi:hypothetical protein
MKFFIQRNILKTDFVSAVEIKAVEILGKFLKKDKDLMDKIMGSDYKRLNRIFDIAQIEYGERSAPAYTRSVKPSIDNVTRKKRGGASLTKKFQRRKRRLLDFLILMCQKILLMKLLRKCLVMMR